MTFLRTDNYEYLINCYHQKFFISNIGKKIFFAIFTRNYLQTIRGTITSNIKIHQRSRSRVNIFLRNSIRKKKCSKIHLFRNKAVV